MKKIILIILVIAILPSTAYGAWFFGKKNPKETSLALKYQDGRHYGTLRIKRIAKVDPKVYPEGGEFFCDIKIIPKSARVFIDVGKFPTGFKVYDKDGKEIGYIDCPDWKNGAFGYKDRISRDIYKNGVKAVF